MGEHCNGQSRSLLHTDPQRNSGNQFGQPGPKQIETKHAVNGAFIVVANGCPNKEYVASQTTGFLRCSAFRAAPAFSPSNEHQPPVGTQQEAMSPRSPVTQTVCEKPRHSFWAVLRSPARSLTFSGSTGNPHKTLKSSKAKGWLGATKLCLLLNFGGKPVPKNQANGV